MSLILFDLDGVLVDAKGLHERAFLAAVDAVAPDYSVTPARHAADLCGLPTTVKLDRLGVPLEVRDAVWRTKQAISDVLIDLVPASDKQPMLDRLVADGHTLGVVTNSTRSTLNRMLARLGLSGFSVELSNEDAAPKPAPDLYRQAMSLAGHTAADTWIVEDSAPGLEAAHASGAHVIQVADASQVTYGRVAPHLWDVLIPMAGAGHRFQTAGYTFPKPLIDVDGQPMIQAVVDNLGQPGRHIFLVRKEHEHRYAVSRMLERIRPDCSVVLVDELTEGAACTALLAADLLSERPLLIANSDQLVAWNPERFADATHGLNGLLPTFTSTHPKWSYVELDDDGYVERVAEKDPISDEATCGIYWWRRGTDFVRAAERMVAANDRVNGEFYIAPTYNYGPFVVRTFRVAGMNGLGTPEDLESYLRGRP